MSSLGYEVRTSTDAREALAEFRVDPARYDLVVSDYLMPQMTGLELARELHAVRPDVRIVLLTGFLEDIPEDELRAAGIREVVKKPATRSELASAVRSALDDPS